MLINIMLYLILWIFIVCGHKLIIIPNIKKYKFSFLHERGKLLLCYIADLEGKLFSGKRLSLEDIPEYKFFTQLIIKQYADSQKFGIRFKKVIGYLKLKLAVDIKFETKFFSEMINGYVQFLAVTLVTWIFVYISSRMIEHSVPKLVLFEMLILQFLGFLSFYFTIDYLKHRKFGDFQKVFQELITFQSYMEVHLPINLAQAESQIMVGTFSKVAAFEDWFNFFLEATNRLKTSGISINDDCTLIISSIFEMQDDFFVKFERQIAFLKFVHLALAFLPAYFLYLSSIFKFFMEQ